MPNFRIDSKTARNKLKPRREPYWHKIQKGGYIGYRRSQEGGTWIARWRADKGKQHFESFGKLNEIDPAEQFDEAQRQASQWFKTLSRTPRAGYTVKHAVDDYVAYLKLNNSKESSEDARQRLYRHVIPSLGNVRLTKLTLSAMYEWRDSRVRMSDDPEDVRRSKDGANRLLSYFKACLNLAYKKDIIGTDKAWRRVEAFKDVGTARKIILDADQRQRLLQSTTGEFHALCKSLLLTGMRPGVEPASLRVEQFDATAGTLEVRRSKTGARTIYLSNAAVKHFKELVKGKLPKAYIHVRDDGTPWGRSHQQRPLQAAVEAARLPAGTNLYALRHTYISQALLDGVNIQVVAENCGTSVRMIEKHYGKFVQTDRRAMFNRVRI